MMPYRNADFPPPFANAYWVIPGRLMAGDFPSTGDPSVAAQRLTRLIDAGIRQMIDLTEPEEIHRVRSGCERYETLLSSAARSRAADVGYLSMPIRDFRAPTRLVMGRILDAIDSSLERNRPVYVHCWAGIGRTGTVIGCYLARHGHASGTDVLDMLQQLRRHTEYAFIASPQSSEQIDLVLSWVAGE